MRRSAQSLCAKINVTVEDIFELIVKLVAKAVLGVVRLLLWISVEFVYEKLLWQIGWLVLRIFTFGHLPKRALNDGENENPISFLFVALLGLSMLLLLAYILVEYLE